MSRGFWMGMLILLGLLLASGCEGGKRPEELPTPDREQITIRVAGDMEMYQRAGHFFSTGLSEY